MSRIQAILNRIQFQTIQILLIIGIIPILISNYTSILKNLDFFNTLLLQNLILILPVIIFLIYKKIKFRDFKIKRISIINCFKICIKYYLIYFILTILIQLITQQLNIAIPGLGESPNYKEIFADLNKIQLFLIAVIIAPIIEEVLFRGLIYHAINGSHTIKIILNSILFSIIHFQFEIIIQILILGLIISYLRYKTDNLTVAIIFHCLNNLITFLALNFL